MSANEPNAGTGLDDRLAALSRDVPPSRDLWPAIEAAITPQRARARRWPYALAATVAICSFGVLLGARIAHERAARAVTAPEAARLKDTEDASFRATRAALEQTYRERLALLAPDTRIRVEADLALIQSAREDIRHALARDPGSPVLVELLQSMTEQEISLYTTVGRNTEPFVPRNRT